MKISKMQYAPTRCLMHVGVFPSMRGAPGFAGEMDAVLDETEIEGYTIVKEEIEKKSGDSGLY